jgi:hypothetical protein
MKISPNYITELSPNQIFVFGSNESGIHGAGAAKMARKWGAVIGKGEGLQGQTYAIPTKDRTVMRTLDIEEIKPYVDRFIDFAIENTHFEFLVTEIGCGLAGLKPYHVAPLFKRTLAVQNILLPYSFVETLYYEN